MIMPSKTVFKLKVWLIYENSLRRRVKIGKMKLTAHRLRLEFSFDIVERISAAAAELPEDWTS